MGHAPPRGNGGPPPTAADFHLGIARSAFLAERIDLDEFERSVEHVLSGGTLTQNGLVPAPRGKTYLVV